MRVLFSLVFFVAGVVLLWVAVTGKTVYYGRLGVRNKDGRLPMPPREGRLTATALGLFFLFIAIWSALHP